MIIKIKKFTLISKHVNIYTYKNRIKIIDLFINIYIFILLYLVY